MVFVFLGLLILLFFLSRTLTTELSLIFYILFRSRKIAVWLMAFLFLPGTIIHEFAHALMAHLLFVHVGKMELMPQLEENSLKLGSVEIGKTDIFRNFLIGVAPFVVGTSLLLLVLFQTFKHGLIGFNLITILVLYFVFVLSNTMYASKKDMEGAIEFFLVIVLPILFLYFLGVRIPGLSWELLETNQVSNFFKMASIFLAIPVVIDAAIILFSRIVRN